MKLLKVFLNYLRVFSDMMPSSNISLCTFYKQVRSPNIIIVQPSNQKININVLTVIQPSDLVQVLQKDPG